MKCLDRPSVVFRNHDCYNRCMPKEADGKTRKRQNTRGEHEKKSTEQTASDEDREHRKKKLPEPPGNLHRRSEWFQKRH